MTALPKRVGYATPSFSIELDGPRTDQRIAEAQQIYTAILTESTPLFRYCRSDNSGKQEMIRWRMPKQAAEAFGFPESMDCACCAQEGVRSELHTDNFEFDTPLTDVAFYFRKDD